MEKFLLLFTIFATSASASENHSYENISFRTWADVSPTVIVCDKSVDFKVLTMAIDFWRSHGFKMSDPVIRTNCSDDILKNHIKFIKSDDPARLKHNENGATDRLFTNTKMYGANIIIKPHLSNQLLLIEHELGHALGLNHSQHSNNVMYHERKYYANVR